MSDINITPEILLNAYAMGYFPMAEDKDDPEFFWVDPDIRGILPLEKFNIPRSLKRFMRQQPFPFTITFNKDFNGVIDGCSEQTIERPETWINQHISDLFKQMHTLGFAHSVECWQNEQLVGGLYGLSLRGAFFGESMFSKTSNASKVALIYLVAALKAANYTLLDTQFSNKHLKQFGVIEVEKEEFKQMLDQAIIYQDTQFSDGVCAVESFCSKDGSTGSTGAGAGILSLLQSMTQTS